MASICLGLNVLTELEKLSSRGLLYCCDQVCQYGSLCPRTSPDNPDNISVVL